MITYEKIDIQLKKNLGPECVWNILFCSLKKSLGRETDTKKSWVILQNFNFGKLKLTKTPILSNCQVPKDFFVNLIIRMGSFAKLLSFLLCQFLWWEVILREREKIFYTYSGPWWFECSCSFTRVISSFFWFFIFSWLYFSILFSFVKPFSI